MKDIITTFLILPFCFSLFGQVNIDDEVLNRALTKINQDMHIKSSIVSLDINSADIILDEENLVVLPEEKVYEIYKNANCSSERRGWTETLTLNKSVNLTKTVSLTKSVVSSKSISVNATFPKVGGSASNSKTITFTNNRIWSENETVTTNRSRSIDLQVEPGKVLYIKLEKTLSKVRVPFKGKVIVDGVVESTYLQAKMGDLYSKKRVEISNLLTKNERTFILEGFIENSSASALSILFDERDVNKNKDCEFSDIVESPQVKNVTVSSEMLEKNKETDLSVEEYVNSTTITTSNSIAHVYVRHLSFGPGFCNVDTRSSSGSMMATNAPPAVWSDWQIIDTHMGEVTFTITNKVNCDTGVRSQVKYYKKEN